MKNQTNKNKSIILGIILVFVITLILLGLTYAYYRTKIIGNSADKSISTTSKKLEVTYEDNRVEVIGIIDTTDTTGEKNTFTKKFAVRNTGTGEAEYSIKITDVTNTFLRREDWTYEIKKASETTSGQTPETYNIPVKSGILPNVDSYLVIKETVGQGETNYYQLTIKYNYSLTEDQSEDMGKNLSFKIDIDNVIDIFTNTSETTLLKAIGNNNPIAINPLTKPGQEPSASNEAELAMTEDDYGTSYYFRGKINNNFVTMGNQCWRIVRVQGNGSIKITLYDETHPCATSEENPAGAFISADGCGDAKGRYHYQLPQNQKENVTFKVCNVQKILDKWYGFENIKLETYADKIEQEAEWCNDVSESTADDGKIYFGAFNRLFSSSLANPSLKCPETKDTEMGTSKYTGKIALLTADEIAFAGSPSSNSGGSLDYYLLENATYSNYWTMSPYAIDSRFAAVIIASSMGPLSYSALDITWDPMVRPVLILNSSVSIEPGGNGTKTNPYVIN